MPAPPPRHASRVSIRAPRAADERAFVALARNGFTREGYSRHYLKIGGRWRDHLRFAILAEDWRSRRR